MLPLPLTVGGPISNNKDRPSGRPAPSPVRPDTFAATARRSARDGGPNARFRTTLADGAILDEFGRNYPYSLTKEQRRPQRAAEKNS
jgi:hypothetical protein